MQTISSYRSASHTLREYAWNLKREYHPSTFKFVRMGNFFESAFGWFLPWEDRSQVEKENIQLYSLERDGTIDEKSIENDLAVVSNDLLISLKRYGKDGTISEW